MRLTQIDAADRSGRPQEAIDQFLSNKIKSTYIVIDPLFAECEFAREEWNNKK